ncbi:hypothetical protein [Devosia sediminis]|uniref:Uncharacterized protein n=1 Tax=Devosia sediminis TaxID=2798801 RepID=A0A934MSE1_9HYPH|nr:hypothetical protein [Devosia sediminis]MBJ3786364.1 hypothetical protein [Devosia sediminis]
MAKPPFYGDLPRGQIGNPLAGFGTTNLRDAMLAKAMQDLEARSFGTANLRDAMRATGPAQQTTRQGGTPSCAQKPADSDKK